MAIVKNIEIDGKEIPFRASADIPRRYRTQFGRDIIKDMAILEKLTKGKDAEYSDIPPECLTMFENIAYTMAKHADKSIPDDPDEWLDEFTVFSIYTILPKLVELWGLNEMTVSEQKKRLSPPTGK